MKQIFYMLLILAGLVGCKQKPVNEWAQWRGPDGQGFSSESDWSHEQLDSTKILWTKNIGWGHSSITVSGERCYASGWKEDINGNDTTKSSTLYCLDLNTGNTIWSFKYPSSYKSFPGPRATPVIDGNKVYQLSWEGMLFCLDKQTGQEIWKRDLTADSLTLVDDWGYNPSPVISGNKLLLNLNQNGIALDKTTGEVLWNSKPFKAAYSSVKLLDDAGTIRGIFTSDTTIRLVNLETGEVLNAYTKNNRKSIHNDVMLPDNHSLFGSNELISYDGTEFRQVWQNDSISSNFRTGFVMDGYAYQFSDYRRKGYLYCIGLNDGAPRWKADLGDWGAVLGTPGRLIILTGLGKLVIAEANPESYNQLAELQVLPGERKQENWCWGIPALCNGRVLVRNSKGDMACIDLRK